MHRCTLKDFTAVIDNNGPQVGCKLYFVPQVCLHLKKARNNFLVGEIGLNFFSFSFVVASIFLFSSSYDVRTFFV